MHSVRLSFAVGLGLVLGSAAASAEDESARSHPKDRSPYSRLAIPDDAAGPRTEEAEEHRGSPVHIIRVVDTVVNNTDPNLKNRIHSTTARPASPSIPAILTTYHQRLQRRMGRHGPVLALDGQWPDMDEAVHNSVPAGSRRNAWLSMRPDLRLWEEQRPVRHVSDGEPRQYL